MVKTKNKGNWLPVLGLLLLFVYYYTSITSYFYVLDETRAVSNRIGLVVGLEIVMIMVVLTNRISKTDKLINSWLLLLASILIDIYILSFFYRLPTFAYYLIVALPFLVLLFINSIIDTFDAKTLINAITIATILLSAHYGFQYYATLAMLNREVMITNAGYLLLLLLPLVICADKRIVRYVLIMIIAMVVISSNKRGGLVAFVLSLVFYIIVKNRTEGKKFRFLSLVFSLAIISLSFYYLFFFSESFTDQYLLSRFEGLEEDAGSGRIDVYALTWDMILSSDGLSLLMGHGWNAVLRDSSAHLSAHNDFLEVLYDYGIVVFVFYLVLIVRLFSKLRRLIKKKSRYAGQFACALTLFMVLSFVSHVILYESVVTIIIIVFSCLIHFDKNDKYENRNLGIPIGN